MGIFDSFKKKDEAPKGLPPEESPTQIIQDMPELPSMPQESEPQAPPLGESKLQAPPPGESPAPPTEGLPQMNQADQTSFEVPDFTDEELDLGPDNSLPEQTSPEPEIEPEPIESLDDLPLFNIKPKPYVKPVAKPATTESPKEEVFSDESAEPPEIFIEKRQYGRLLLAEERLLTGSKELQDFIGSIYGFIKDEKVISESLASDFMSIQKELMSMDTELFEKEDQK